VRDAQGRPALASDSVCIHTGLQPGVSARAEQKPEALEAELSSLTTKASGAVVLNRTVSQTIADVLSFAVYKADRFHASEAGERARDTLTSNSKSINKQRTMFQLMREEILTVKIWKTSNRTPLDGFHRFPF
jgi:hypothetical protein